MKSMVKILMIVSILFIATSCNNTATEPYSPYTPISVYDGLVANNIDEISELLKDNIDINKTIDICYPVYAFDLLVDSLTIQQRYCFPDDNVFFPVLEDNTLLGFVVYFVKDEDFSEPLFLGVSSEAVEKINSGSTLRIAYATWKIDSEHADYACEYIFIADDNTVSNLIGDYPIYSPLQISYKSVKGLSELNKDKLEVIETFKYN